MSEQTGAPETIRYSVEIGEIILENGRLADEAVVYIRADLASEAIAALRELVAIQDAQMELEQDEEDTYFGNKECDDCELDERENALINRRNAVDFAARQIIERLK